MDARNLNRNTAFQAPWWLRSPHLQTLWPVFFRRRPKLALTEERVTLPDGDFLDICWMTEKKPGPYVLVLHGLEGSLHSHYAGSTLLALHRQGFNPVFMHFRGCSGVPNRLPRGYHSGDTGDIAFIARHIEQQCGQSPAAAVGFSLGGNVLLKWLGEQAENSNLKAAVAVSVPFQLNDCALRLEKGLSKIYRQHLIKRLKQSYQRKFHHMTSPLNIDLNRIRTFRDFDHRITAPLHGFDSVDHYYNNAGSRQFLKHIRVPTLLIHAVDDPFMWPQTAPTESELSEHITLELSPTGGHVGFVTGSAPWRATYWLEKRISAFLKMELRIDGWG